MDQSSILSALSERHSLLSQSSSWSSSVTLTSSLLSTQIEESSLLQSLLPLRDITSRLEEELTSNSEYAQRLRDLHSLESRIADLESLSSQYDSAAAQLSAAIASLTTRCTPLRTESSLWLSKEVSIQTSVHHLDSAVQMRSDRLEQSRELLNDFIRRDVDLRAREQSLVDRLLTLREREAGLRSAELEPRVPTVDVSAMLCPLPRVSGASASAPIDPLLDGSAIDQIERLKVGNAIRRHGDSVTCLSFSPTQPMIASGGEDTVVALMRTDTSQILAQLTDAKGSIMAVAFSPTEQLLLSASWDHAVRLYRIATNNMALAYNCKDHTDCVYDAKFLSDDRFVSCSRDQTVRLFDIKNMAPITSFTSASRPFSVCSLQGGSLVVTAHFDGKLRGWDFRTRGAPLELKVHKGTVGFVTGLQGVTNLLSFGSDDKMLIMSDLRGKSVLGKVAHRAAVSREKIQLALWGDQAIIGGQNGQICAYDLTAFKLKETMKGVDAPVYCVAAKQNFGLATGDQTGAVKFWFQ